MSSICYLVAGDICFGCVETLAIPSDRSGMVAICLAELLSSRVRDLFKFIYMPFIVRAYFTFKSFVYKIIQFSPNVSHTCTYYGPIFICSR